MNLVSRKLTLYPANKFSQLCSFFPSARPRVKKHHCGVTIAPTDPTSNVSTPRIRQVGDVRQDIERSRDFGRAARDLCRRLETSVTHRPSMNRGGVTKRRLGRDTRCRRGARGERRYRTTLRHRPTLRSSLAAFRVYTVLLRLLRPLTAPLFPLSLFPSPCLLAASLPRCLTPFSLRESHDDSCTRFARYRERIKSPPASDE